MWYRNGCKCAGKNNKDEMNAMNGYRGTKSHIQRVCERMCVRACMCAERKKRNDGGYESFPRQIPETVEVLRTVQRHQRGSDE